MGASIQQVIEADPKFFDNVFSVNGKSIYCISIDLYA